MAIKETPITWRAYYKNMIHSYTQKKEEALEILKDLNETVTSLHASILKNKDTYKKEFQINLDDYEEFVNNEYKDGIFIKLAKGAFLNRKNNYLLVADLYDLFNLARKQKDVYDILKDIELYDNMINIEMYDYRDILKLFYEEVHRQMILNGKGYAFEGDLGWICINRCVLEKVRPHLDYAATRKKKEELIAQGKRPYKKEEADWCNKNHIPYDGVPYRVFQKVEAVYEIPLIHCKLPDGRKFKLDISDYRGTEVRGKTNQDLINEANGDLEYICKLPVCLRTKLNLCLQIDKTLYTNFIRNENQEPANAIKVDRKNR